jgi:hypothetical protein
VPCVPLHGVRIWARIEEHAVCIPIEMSGYGKAQPVVGRTERLARQFLHAPASLRTRSSDAT